MTREQKRNDKLKEIIFDWFSGGVMEGEYKHDEDKLDFLRRFENWVVNFAVNEYWYDPENKKLESVLKKKYGEDYKEKSGFYIEYEELILKSICIPKDVCNGITKEMRKKWKNKFDLINSSGAFLYMCKEKSLTARCRCRCRCKRELMELIDEMKDDVKQILLSILKE